MKTVKLKFNASGHWKLHDSFTLAPPTSPIGYNKKSGISIYEIKNIPEDVSVTKIIAKMNTLCTLYTDREEIYAFDWGNHLGLLKGGEILKPNKEELRDIARLNK